MKKIILSLLILTNLALSSDFEDGIKAFKRGEYKKAFDFYKKSCDSGNISGCINLGILYEIGQGVKQDYFKAVEIYKKYCDIGNTSSCNSLGLMYEFGHGVNKDIKKAKELYEKACKLKDQLGCEYYKRLNSQGH